MITLAIVVILTNVAITAYGSYREKAVLATAIIDIQEIESRITDYFLHYHRYPSSLAAIDFSRTDPWGNPYQYLNFALARGRGGQRKDKNLVPINSDYDLYSMGPDGRSVSPLTAKASRDDIIRASDGAYIGPAANY